MVLSDVDIRDLSTVGALHPEARTVLFKANAQSDLPVLSIAVAKRFIVLATEKAVSIFPTDAPSSVLPHPQGSTKKGTTPILGGSTVGPVASFEVTDLLTVDLCANEEHLVVFASAGVHTVKLSDPNLTVSPLIKERLDSGCVVGVSSTEFVVCYSAGTYIRYASITVVDGSLKVSESKPLLPESKSGKPSTGKSTSTGKWMVRSCNEFVAAAFGNERVGLAKWTGSEFTLTGSASLSPQCGEVLGVCPIARGALSASAAFGPTCSGAIVHQREVVSILKQGSDDDDELELLFQFRDAINKLVFTCVDVRKSSLLTISFEAFSRRYRLEMFDLSLLKVKAAALAPVRRWDITRLVAGQYDESSVKVFHLNRPLPSFLLTGVTDSSGVASTGILWEPVVKDHWFSFMPNFSVLNKNEPYQEAEDEFDFNQLADPAVVRSTINRYKRSVDVTLDFLPPPDKAAVKESSEPADVDMIDVKSNDTRDVLPEVTYPFLQPLPSWRTGDEGIYRPTDPVGGTDVKFFSEGCRDILNRIVNRQ